MLHLNIFRGATLIRTLPSEAPRTPFRGTEMSSPKELMDVAAENDRSNEQRTNKPNCDSTLLLVRSLTCASLTISIRSVVVCISGHNGPSRNLVF